MGDNNHNYERIKLLNKHTVFIQSGIAGRLYYEFEEQKKESVHQNDNSYAITKILVTPSSLMGQFMSHGRKILDNFSIYKV